MEKREIKSFSRRVGRALRPAQKELLNQYLSERAVIGKDQLQQLPKCVLEIGFGNGENIERMARANPDTMYVGAEPYLNGVASLFSRLHANPIPNLLVWPNDVRILLDKLSGFLFDEIYIICPDPWPKKRHIKRRLINSEFLSLLTTFTKHIIIVTDHEDYAQHILEAAITSSQFGSLDHDLGTYKSTDFALTKYQQRGLDMGAQIYLFRLVYTQSR